MAKAGRKKKVKKARGIQAGSPTKATSGIDKQTRYKNKQKQMKGLYHKVRSGGCGGYTDIDKGAKRETRERDTAKWSLRSGAGV